MLLFVLDHLQRSKYSRDLEDTFSDRSAGNKLRSVLEHQKDSNDVKFQNLGLFSILQIYNKLDLMAVISLSF